MIQVPELLMLGAGLAFLAGVWAMNYRRQARQAVGATAPAAAAQPQPAPRQPREWRWIWNILGWRVMFIALLLIPAFLFALDLDQAASDELRNRLLPLAVVSITGGIVADAVLNVLIGLLLLTAALQSFGHLFSGPASAPAAPIPVTKKRALGGVERFMAGFALTIVVFGAIIGYFYSIGSDKFQQLMELEGRVLIGGLLLMALGVGLIAVWRHGIPILGLFAVVAGVIPVTDSVLTANAIRERATAPPPPKRQIVRREFVPVTPGFPTFPQLGSPFPTTVDVVAPAKGTGWSAWIRQNGSRFTAATEGYCRTGRPEVAAEVNEAGTEARPGELGTVHRIRFQSLTDKPVTVRIKFGVPASQMCPF